MDYTSGGNLDCFSDLHVDVYFLFAKIENIKSFIVYPKTQHASHSLEYYFVWFSKLYDTTMSFL